jgi:hypothetical protein
VEPLREKQKATLRRCSPEELALAMLSGREHISQGRWLGKRNRYRIETATRIDDETSANGSIRKPNDLKTYVAASALPHCMDGWGFLARAVSAHIAGNANAALHFGYYAELRAAMSLLATRGVGIFNKGNCVIAKRRKSKHHPQGSGCLSLRGPGTHNMTWLSLKFWGSMPTSSTFLLNIVTPARIPLFDWISAYSQPVPSQLGAKWLHDWGLDLRQFAEDRDARNEVSYRPIDITRDAFIPAKEASSFLIDFWSLFEPAASRFETLDSHILRNTLEQVFKGRNQQNAVGNPQHQRNIATMVTSLGLVGNQEWTEFLLRRKNPASPRVLKLAAEESDLDDPDRHLQVISRAALLLRLATGACEALKNDATLSRGDLSFWWSTVGSRRGFWSPGSEPTNCTDLWSEVEVATQGEQNWGNANWLNNPSYMSWKQARAADLVVLSECERIGLWGLGF